MNRVQNYIMGTDTSPLVLPKVCFVSDDGACLAPMAAAVYNYLSDLHALNRHAIFAAEIGQGSRVDPMVHLALDALGIPCASGHGYGGEVPSLLTEGAVSGCEVIVCLDPSRIASLVGRFPMYASRFTSLSDTVTRPASGELADYKFCAEKMVKLIRKDFEF